MKLFRIQKIDSLSGNKCSIYSILDCRDETKTLLDLFIDENISLFKSETKELVTRLRTIGNLTGARVQFFKNNEGIPGDGVCALFDMDDSNLRLYCIRYGMQLIIVGGGGYKPKGIRTLQEDEKLKYENYFLRKVSQLITNRIKDKEIEFINDGLDFDGNLTFSNEDFE